MFKSINKLLFFLIYLLFSVNVLADSYEITYYHNNFQGSPVVAAGESGNVVWEEDYSAYGERLKKEADTTDPINN